MGPFFTLRRFVAFVAFPYLVGFLFSHRNLHFVLQYLAPALDKAFSSPQGQRILQSDFLSTSHSVVANNKEEEFVGFQLDACYEALLQRTTNPDHFVGLTTQIHRNGESEPCGSTTVNLATELRQVLDDMSHRIASCPNWNDKYQVESLLTRLFQHLFQAQCISLEDDRSPADGFYGFCDLGETRTPILLDHNKLVPVMSTNGTKSYLPCHFHDPHGVRVTSLSQLSQLAAEPKQQEPPPEAAVCRPDADGAETCAADDDANASNARTLHLYAVPAGRMFLHTASYLGQIIPLPHVQGGDPSLPVYLQVLSVRPAVFDVHNFFTKTESQDLVDRALAETKESHRMKRSSTGASGYNVNQRRTSENGFDTGGRTSMTVKRRCFDVLGFDEYIESHADGLQVLRYNLTTAYNSHMDWIDGNDELEHDYESGLKGGNRFATILLYMSDLGENDGGETVFAEAWPPNQLEEDHVEQKTAIQQLRESEHGSTLAKGSWEETLAAKCRTQLAIRPNSARAVLFYSQLPNGKPDRLSLHGACPVLAGQKYAANLWVWNTPRAGYANSPRNPNYKSKETKTTQGTTTKKSTSTGPITATFSNEKDVPEFEHAELFYRNGNDDKFWGKLGHFDPPLAVNTYVGHQWVIKVDGQELKSWRIDSSDPPQQEFVI